MQTSSLGAEAVVVPLAASPDELLAAAALRTPAPAEEGPRAGSVVDWQGALVCWQE